jgi:lipoprotein-releasing system permease protein
LAFSAVERLVAFRYLRARRQEGFVSVITAFSLAGIALGVATLIIVMAVMNGFRAELLGRIIGLNGHVTIYASAGQTLPNFDAMVAKIRQLPDVRMVAPLVEGQVMATANGAAGGALVRGMRREDFAARPLLAGNIQAGSLNDFTEDSVIIGRRLAQRQGLSVGNDITLISPQGNATPFGTVPRVKSFRVAAIFEVGMFEYDSSYIYMPLDTAQSFFRTGAGVTAVEVLVADPQRVAPLVRSAYDVIPSGGRVLDWQQANASFFNAIQVERNVMFLILTLIILVAAFNIISSMIMLVKDKGREVAVLRTMGATRGAIMRIFFMAGASIGVVGCLAGLALGVSFSLNIETIRQWLQGLTGTELFSAEIYFLSRLPARLDWNEVIQVVVMALTLSILATIYPSWRAARLDPVEALRYE